MDAALSVPSSHNLTVMSTMLLAEPQGEALQDWLHHVHARCVRLGNFKPPRITGCRGRCRSPARCNGRKPSRAYTGMQVPYRRCTRRTTRICR